MPDYKDQNVVSAYHAANRKKAQLWAITFLTVIVCAAALFYFVYEPGSQTTAEGRKVESPSTATSGAAR
jgi:hypothetical protein